MSEDDKFVIDKAVQLTVTMMHAGLLQPEDNVGQVVSNLSTHIRGLCETKQFVAAPVTNKGNILHGLPS